MRIISGYLKNRKLNAPKGVHTRPTSERLRESLFNICQTYIEGTQFLDLFSGSGAIGIEALSRGAAYATFIDNHKESIQCIKRNIEELQLEGCSQIICGEVSSMMNRLHKQYDMIFMDPPYDQGLEKGVIDKIDKSSLLKEGGFLFIESSLEDPLLSPRETLELFSSRRIGKSMLLQFRKTL